MRTRGRARQGYKKLGFEVLDSASFSPDSILGRRIRFMVNRSHEGHEDLGCVACRHAGMRLRGPSALWVHDDKVELQLGQSLE